MRGLLLLAVLGACATSDGSATVDGGFEPTVDASDVDSAANDPDAATPDAAATADASVDASSADAPSVDAALPPDAMPDATLPPDAMPDATLPPDATPDAMLPPDACVPGWINLLANGGFEQMTTGWTQTGGTIIRQFTAGNPWPAFEGTWASLFGGVNNASHQLTQVVSVPTDATGLRLRGHLCFVTEEITTVTAYDTLTVQVQGAVTEQYVFSNLDAGATCSWTSFQLDAPSSHAGESITLRFAGSTDGSLITSFALDALALEAFACP